jgi:SAM-dependent methyltransferase
VDAGSGANSEQAKLWNSSSGRAWVDAQALLDRVFEPLEERLDGEVAAAGARAVLDVGCGAGATTLAVARRLGTGGRVTGVDISEPLIAAARARAQREGTNAEFVRADAQTHAFDPASVDMIISRFGVMFFDDFVAAFANLRRATRDNGALRLLVWRGPAENPFMTAAERAAVSLMPDMPPRDPDAPGQFALADPGRVSRILDDSGWKHVELRPVDVRCTFPEKELVDYFTRLGPLGRVLSEADDETRGRVVEVVRPAFDRWVHGDEVRFDAACWMVCARPSP